jgi:hypothetical protein
MEYGGNVAESEEMETEGKYYRRMSVCRKGGQVLRPL